MRAYQKAAVFLLLAAVGFASAWSPSARAADDILELMPDNTLAFVVVNDAGDLSEKLVALGQQIDAPVPPLLEVLKSQTPAAQEVDFSRPAGVVITPGGAKGVGGVILLPVKDFEAFVKAAGAEDSEADLVKIKLHGDEMVATSVGGYAVLSDASNADSIRAAADNDGSVAEDFADLRERLHEADVMGGATHAGIERAAAFVCEKIEEVKQHVTQAQAGPGAPPAFAVEGLKFYTMLAQAIEANVDVYGFVVSLDKKAVRGTDILVWKGAKGVADTAEIETIGLDALESLPGGKAVLVLAGVTPAELSNKMLSFSKQTMLAMQGIYGLDADQVEALIEESRPLMEPLRSMSFSMQVPRKTDAPLYGASGGLFQLESGAEAYLDRYARVVEKMDQQMKKSGEAAFSMGQTEKIEVDGKPGLQLTVTVDLGASVDDPAARQALDTMMETFYGPGGKLHMYMVAVDDQTIALAYVSKANLRRYMAMADTQAEAKSLADRPAYEKLVKMLPAQAQWIGILDLAGYRDLVCRVVGPMSGMIPELGAAAPVGMAVQIKADRCEIDGVIPTATIKTIVDAVEQFRQRMSGARTTDPGRTKVAPIAPRAVE